MYEDHCVNDICLPKRCRTDKDCGPGNKCTSRKCMIRCQHRGQCSEDEKCIDNYCSIPPGNHLCDLLLNLT